MNTPIEFSPFEASLLAHTARKAMLNTGNSDHCVPIFWFKGSGKTDEYRSLFSRYIDHDTALRSIECMFGSNWWMIIDASRPIVIKDRFIQFTVRAFSQRPETIRFMVQKDDTEQITMRIKRERTSLSIVPTSLAGLDVSPQFRKDILIANWFALIDVMDALIRGTYRSIVPETAMAVWQAQCLSQSLAVAINDQTALVNLVKLVIEEPSMNTWIAIEQNLANKTMLGRMFGRWHELRALPNGMVITTTDRSYPVHTVFLSLVHDGFHGTQFHLSALHTSTSATWSVSDPRAGEHYLAGLLQLGMLDSYLD